MLGSKGVYIVAAKRTAFGSFGGKLKSFTAVELGAHASKAAIAELPSADIIDGAVFGNVLHSTPDCAYLARHVALKAGVKIEAPALTVNRLCLSGFQSIISASQDILLGDGNVMLAGGAESMSMAPYHVQGVRFGGKLGVNPPMIDVLWETLKDAHINCPMALTAENLAEKYGITKDDADSLALLSQQRWAAANEAGLFKSQIAPVPIKDRKKGEIMFDTDEHPRPQSTIESISKLPPIFKKNGTVSASNASGINDGAAAVILASEDAVKQHGLKPLARIVSYANAGVEPEFMGIGPVPAMKEAISRAGLTLDDMDLIEVNEAFASQFLACQKELGLDMDKTNLQGGATAMGHPVGVSGTRIMGHLAHELQRTGKKYAIGSACGGGGQGTAILIEKF